MKERLQKVIARAGVTSRRKAEDLILNKKVKVNGRIVNQLGHKIDPLADTITINGRPINVNLPKIYLMLHKPRGYLTTVQDERGRPTVMDLISCEYRVFPVGRLDQETEGLLLLTNDGSFSHLVTHPSYKVTKTYEAWIEGKLTPNKLSVLMSGILLDDGLAKALNVNIIDSWAGGYCIKMVMAEGRKRIVRRMFDALDTNVKRLIRRKIGLVSLGQLEPGKSRPLTKLEVASLFKEAQLNLSSY